MVRAHVTADYPLASFHLMMWFVFDNPIAAVASLAPPGGLILLPLEDRVIQRINVHIFSELPHHVALVNTIIDVVVLSRIGFTAESLAAYDFGNHINSRLANESARLSYDFNVLFREEFIKFLGDLRSDSIKSFDWVLLSISRLGKASAKVQKVHLDSNFLSHIEDFSCIN